MSAPPVLIAAGCPHATVTRYRCLHLQEQLAANGIDAAVEEWYDLDRIDSQMALPERALVLQRVPMTAALAALIDRMNAAGRPVIFDVDDLVFEPQLASWHRGVANLSPAEQGLYLDGVRRYAKTLGRCDHVLAASLLLAELAARHGPQAHVLRNALGEEMAAWAQELYQLREARLDARQAEDRLVIGYGSGTATHDVDFAEAAPAVLDILTRYAHAELWIAGPMRLPAELAQFGPRVRRFPLLPWRDWFQLAAQMDIALAPLEMNNLFCRAKSEIKFVEAGALGVPTVASQIDPFAAAIRPGENGLLAANPAEWLAALDQLAADAALRRRVGAAARQTVVAHYSPQARATDLAQLLPRLLARPRPQNQTSVERMEPIEQPTAAPAGAQPPAEQPAPAPTTTGLTATGLTTTGLTATDHAEDNAGDEPFVPLTIHWLVTEPFAGSGGHIGIFRMIRHLVDFGHICHVHTIPVNFMHGYTPAQIEKYVNTHFMPTGAIFHQWSGEIGPADATVATYWKTVPLLLKLPMAGRRYYLVQDFEPYFYPVGSEYIQAENTYRQGLHCLTLGPWLAKLMAEQYGAEADHFDFAVDTDIYMPLPGPRPAHPRLAFYARPSTPRRAYELGVEALHLINKRAPQVEIIFYGAQTLPPPPFPVTNAGILNPWELAKLFSTCDVGLVFSTTNPSFVPLEMMACRCAVVDLASERVVGLLEDGVNCRLAQPTPESIADTVLDLLWDRERRAAMVETAFQQVEKMSWRRSARQLEAAMLRHAPPPASRVAWRAASSEDIDMLAWQIHQLLDAGGDNAAVVDALRSALYRTLAEKAALVQHVQQVEQQYVATARSGPVGGARTALQPLADRVVEGAPGWLQGRAPLGKLTLSQAPLCQAFCADRSHLRRIELRFAPRLPVHTGSISVTLYEGEVGGRLVASELLRVGELPLDAPCAIDFAPEVDSYGKQYVLCVAAVEVSGQPPAIWRFVQPQLAGAALHQDGQPLHGQIAIQPFFGEYPPPVPPRQGPAAWDQPVRLAPTVVREVVSQRVSALGTLAGKARAALQQRGVAGLGREVLNYVEWQLNGRGQE